MSFDLGQVGSLLGVDARVVAAFEIHDAGTDVFVFSLTGFAFTVKVPNWLGEGLENIGTLFGKGIVNMVRRDNVGFASLEGSGDAEQSDDVGVV